MRVLTLLLALFCSVSTAQSYAEEPVIVSAECGKERFGASTLTSDGKNVVVCLIADDESKYIWKSTTSKPSSIPVGAVIAWPALIDPPDMQNWLECKGQAIAQSAYPELYAVIGGKVPDYRGLFLRGLGSQTYAQNNGSAVGVTSTAHSSAALGVVQGDAIRNIVGEAGNWATPDSWHSAGAIDLINHSGAWISSGYSFNKFGFRINAGKVVPTANENRPVNTAVRYLIRAKS